MTRGEILSGLRGKRESGVILQGRALGRPGSAQLVKREGADLAVVYNTGDYAGAGRGILSGLMAYGDANRIVAEAGTKILPLLRDIPVFAGVCGTDPFRVMEVFLKRLKKQGFAGIQNFPTVGLLDGTFRRNLEETQMGYGLEAEMIRIARSFDMLTMPLVFDTEQAGIMALAGADILVAHMGLATRNAVENRTKADLEDCAAKMTKIGDAARRVNPDILLFCHGGLLTGPSDLHFMSSKARHMDGFFDIVDEK